MPANGTLKYPELCYEQKLLWKPKMYGTKETAEQFDVRHNCCFVRHTEQRCNIVVRFNENFDMFSGSAVLIAVGIGQNKPFAKHESQGRYHGMECNTYEADMLLEEERLRSAPQFEYTVRQKTKAVFQQIVLRGPDGQGFDVPQFQEGDDFECKCGVRSWNPSILMCAAEEETYYGIDKKAHQDMVNPGVLAVIVQRGNANWLDGENKPMKEQRYTTVLEGEIDQTDFLVARTDLEARSLHDHTSLAPSSISTATMGGSCVGSSACDPWVCE